MSRAGGVSWRQAHILDDYGDETHVTFIDRDSRWQDLLSDPEWDPEPGVGGYSFLDPIGFRYFIAPGMIRSVEAGYDRGVTFHLRMPGKEPKDLRNHPDLAHLAVKLAAFSHDSRVAHRLETWSLITAEQGRVVARFLQYMDAAVSSPDPAEYYDTDFREALECYWSRFLA